MVYTQGGLDASVSSILDGFSYLRPKSGNEAMYFQNSSGQLIATISNGGHSFNKDIGMGGYNISSVGTLQATNVGTSTSTRITNGYFTTANILNLYVNDLYFKNDWKIDDSTDELLIVSPSGKKYRMKMEEV